MAFNTKIDLTNAKVYQADGQQLTLSGDTSIATVGDLRYVTHPTFTGNTQIVDKKYVDDKVITATGQSIYNLASPATVTVGGVTAGTTLTGKSSNCILKEILVPYLLPTFSSFSNDVSTPVEVGCQISGSHSFSWAFTNSGNVCPAAFVIRDVTLPGDLSTGTSTSPVSTTITTKTFASCGDTQVWCGCAKNTNSTLFGSAGYTVTGLLPYFWGKCTCPGPAGANRPTLTAPQVTGGTKIVANSSGSISINFNSTANDYLWFAIPDSVAAKTTWYVDAINNGAIGGGVSPACQLFPTPVSLGSVQNVCWSGQTYKVYVSNKQTAQTLSIAIG